MGVACPRVRTCTRVCVSVRVFFVCVCPVYEHVLFSRSLCVVRACFFSLCVCVSCMCARESETGSWCMTCSRGYMLDVRVSVCVCNIERRDMYIIPYAYMFNADRETGL